MGADRTGSPDRDPVTLSAQVPRFPGAACEGRADIDWVPDVENTRDPNTQAAILVCFGCPARIACAEYAINQPSLYGIWGGLLWWQRKELRLAGARPLLEVMAR